MKSIDIEDRARALCFGFENYFYAAADTDLRELPDFQQPVEEGRSAPFQLDEGQSQGLLELSAIVINGEKYKAPDDTSGWIFTRSVSSAKQRSQNCRAGR